MCDCYTEEVKKVCAWCHERYDARRRDSKCCSKRHSNAWHKAESRKRATMNGKASPTVASQLQRLGIPIEML